MSDEEPRKVKVTVKDKRVATQSAADRSSDALSPSRASQSGPSSEGRIAAEASSDKASAAASAPVNDTAASAPTNETVASAAPETAETEVDYLAELQRERADFENYRKRMMREVASSGERAKAVIAEKLLPVLDNFERAIAHGEGGEGVALVFRELKTALESEGLEEVPAEGEVFDPNLHEAVMSADDDSVEQPTVKEVHRRGYRFGDRLLRAAMVSVARPPEAAPHAKDTKE